MPQTQRMRVFKGELAKTSGGLRKNDLVRNKRGKIVSRKKSAHAHGNENNLGSWLRGKGDKFGGKPKGLKEGLPAPKVAKAKPKAAPKKAAPKPKPAPKKKKLSSKATVVSLPKPSSRPKKTKTEPLQAGEKKDLSKVSVGNIIVKKTESAAEKKKQQEKEFQKLRAMGFSQKEIEEAYGIKGGSFAKKLLKASKRKGKRRTKKQLLRDVLP